MKPLRIAPAEFRESIAALNEEPRGIVTTLPDGSSNEFGSQNTEYMKRRITKKIAAGGSHHFMFSLDSLIIGDGVTVLWF
jgi:hypothetical protein